MSLVLVLVLAYVGLQLLLGLWLSRRVTLVAIEGRIRTRQWEDDRKIRHWRTEIVASQVEMLSGRRKRDYASESAAEALAAQAAQLGVEPHELAEPPDDGTDEDDELEDELELDPEAALAVAAA